jgi:hypothetical protein
MKIMNCASLIALVAGGLVVSTPAAASPLSPASLTASHDMLHAVSLPGDEALRGPLSHQQQQQQQQRRNLVAEAGVIYGAPLGGFNV